MAQRCRMFGNALKEAFMGNIVWGTNIKMALMDATYSPYQDINEEAGEPYTQMFFDNSLNGVASFEIPATGNYTSGGKAIPIDIPLTSYDNSPSPGGTMKFLASADLLWENLTASFYWGVIYCDTGDKPLIGYVEFVPDLIYSPAVNMVNLSAQDFTVQFPSGVVFSVSLDTSGVGGVS